jgi:protein phosphatase 1G
MEVFIQLKQGAEVSTFVERHFIEELESNPNYQKANFEQALRETFLKMDVLLASPSGKEEIIKIQK